MTQASSSEGSSAPLLAGVVAEELFVQLPADAIDDYVLGRRERMAWLGHRCEEALQLQRRVARAIQLIDGVQIDRNRHQLAVHRRAHPMLVGPPVGEPRQIPEHFRGIGVEDMRSILVDQNAVLVVIVEGVAADVRPLVADQHALAGMSGQTLGDGGAGKAGADDQVVEHDVLQAPSRRLAPGVTPAVVQRRFNA